MSGRRIHLTCGDEVRVRKGSADCFEGEEGVVRYVRGGLVYVDLPCMGGATFGFFPELLETKETIVKWWPVFTSGILTEEQV